MVKLGVPDDCLELDAHRVEGYAAKFHIHKHLFKQHAELANVLPTTTPTTNMSRIEVHNDFVSAM